MHSVNCGRAHLYIKVIDITQLECPVCEQVTYLSEEVQETLVEFLQSGEFEYDNENENENENENIISNENEQGEEDEGDMI